MSSAFPVVQVASKNVTDKHLNDRLRDVILANNGACYDEMEPYLIAPGVTGSRAFDQHAAVRVLLEHDRSNEKHISTAMSKTPRLNERILWDKLVNVLRGFGYRIKHGRIVGVVHALESDDDSGEPDVD